MGVFAAGSQGQPRANQSSQSIRHGRTSFRDPNRIGDHYRIGAGNLGSLFETGAKMRTTDLFFKLPEKANIDWHALIDRETGTEQRRQRRPLVIGCPTATIDASLVLEGKRIPLPFWLLCRLNIHMVIDRDRRIVCTSDPASGHKRIAASLHDLRFGAD